MQGPIGKGAGKVGREVLDAGGLLLKEAAISAALSDGIGSAFRRGSRMWEAGDRRRQRALWYGASGKLDAQARARGRSRILEGGKLARINGRQMWRSDDGYVETERTMTVQRDDGRWVNIPSFDPRTGRDYPSERAALEGARREGYVMKSYRDLKSAEIGAAAKSRRTGEELRKRGY